MSDTAQSIYRAWANSDELTPEMLHRIYTRADKTNNTDLLVDLARRKDLPADLEEKIVARKELEVLLAWARRNSDNPELIVNRVLTDKRATLLLELAGQPELDIKVYSALAKSNSKKVAVALATNSAVPDSVIKTIDRLVVSAVNGEHRGSAHLARTLVSMRPWISRLMVEETTSGVARLIAATEGNLDSDGQIAAMRLLVGNLRRLDDYAVSELFEKFLNQPLPDEALELLRPQAEKAKDNLNGSWYLRRVNTSIINAVGRIGFDRLALLKRLAEAPASEIADVYAQARQAVTEQKMSAKNLADPIWSNPASTFSMLANEVQNADQKVIRARLLDMEAKGQYELMISLLDERFTRYFDVDLLVDPAKVVELGASRPGQKATWVTNSKHWRENPTVALQFQLAPLLLTSAATVNAARDIVVARLSTPEQWEMFEGLVGEFTGSLPELLETVTMLSGN